MFATELAIERRKRREEFKNNYLGTARQAGYYDAAEALVMTGPFIGGGLNAVRTRALVAYAWIRLGVPAEQVCAAYDVNPDWVQQLTLDNFILRADLRAEIERQVVEAVPETPEPQRFVTAYPRVGALQTDQSAGPPQVPNTSAEGSAPAQYVRR
jgi:hypothetical protein